MGLPVEQKRRYTLAEYFELERTSAEKHEYVDGEILMMAGGSENHSLIITNTIRSIGNRLQGKPCRVYESNLRIRIPRTPLYVYPDISIICGPTQRDPDDHTGNSVTNPRLVIEVLSPSTEGYDRGRKFERYMKLESLEEYVLVSQETARVESFWRREGGSWLLTPVSGIEGAAKLRSLDIELPLREIYAGVEFPPLADESIPS